MIWGYPFPPVEPPNHFEGSGSIACGPAARPVAHPGETGYFLVFRLGYIFIYICRCRCILHIDIDTDVYIHMYTYFRNNIYHVLGKLLVAPLLPID